ncbi:MAG: helix-turn-helix domain-containing protein [candidate division Zixibacteria bacterium]|nr:helix-turn-helix domain-containing protein [candidate division Zixibacteria bacterium]
MSIEKQEIAKRKQCIELYKADKSPTEIHQELHRSRPWVYKWIHRYKSGDPQWCLDQSKAPKTHPLKINDSVETEIIRIRQTLIKRDTASTRYAYHGAIAIHQELQKNGHKGLPHISTINRVLKRNGLIKHTHSEPTSNKSGIYYPEKYAKHPSDIYELDLVTPRYIKGFGRIISVNRVDTYLGEANMKQYLEKAADNIVEFIVSDWTKHAKPNYLRLDNEACFRGSLIHERTFGKLVRFCLNFGVQIIFIPFREPWRNGFIESFNSRFKAMLWEFMQFDDLNHLREESKLFLQKHNEYQRYKKLNFSNRNLISYQKKRFPDEFNFKTEVQLPITKGFIHIIRFVNEKGCVNILNEDFYIGKTYSFCYIWGTIDTAKQQLFIYFKSDKLAPRILIKIFDYSLRESVEIPIPINHFI